ncbi:MAG TPA: sulfatase [Vicinamibacteria bacterium]|nr:sulfatase [Vicinamibacteria bacterium]
MARLSAAAVVGLLAACAPRPAVDLLAAGDRIVAADVAGRDVSWLRGQLGKAVRIGDDQRRVIPAAPPSRIVLSVDVPRGARLAFACGLGERRWDRAPVEFVVKVRRGGREQVVFTQLVDPANRPAHRGFVAGEAELGRHGKAEIVLETRSAETPEDPRAVAWATPSITSEANAPLAVVYLVDTLRADHTSVYGYSRDTTPELLRFADRAVVFETAVAPSSWTKPSVASLLTSLLPGSHGAVHLRDPLPPQARTLAERLQERGFATAAFVANSVIYEKASGFERGFDVFKGVHDREGRPSTRALAEDVVSEALDWLHATKGRPAFLYVHTMDPHIPYTPPAPFDALFDPAPTAESPGRDPREQEEPGPHRDSYVARYDGEVAYGDREFGRFVRGLHDAGRLDGAFVAFLADHGEEFLEHGHFGHGTSLYDELVRIPLVVKLPGGRHAGRRVKQQVQAIDVAPGLFEALGLPLETPPPAPSLLRSLDGRSGGERPALLEISHRGIVAHGVRTERDKYVRRFSPDSDERLFDLVSDPGETRDLAESQRERVRALRAQVEPTLLPNPFRHVVRVAGGGNYRLEIETGGLIQEVASEGLGSAESATQVGSGRLVLSLRPTAAAGREVSFVVRPRGAGVRLQGTRGGRALDSKDVWLGAAGTHPTSLPALLPDLDGEGSPFAPRIPPQAGVAVWLALAAGRQVMDLDAEAQERLRALGYLGK